MMLWEYLKNKMQFNMQQEVCENNVSMTFEDLIIFAEEFSRNLKGIKCCAILCQSEMVASMALLSGPIMQKFGRRTALAIGMRQRVRN